MICWPAASVEYAMYVVGGRVLPVDEGAVCCPRLTDASVPVTRPASCPPTPGAADVVTGSAPASIVSSVVVAPAGSTEYTTVLPLG